MANYRMGPSGGHGGYPGRLGTYFSRRIHQQAIYRSSYIAITPDQNQIAKFNMASPAGFEPAICGLETVTSTRARPDRCGQSGSVIDAFVEKLDLSWLGFDGVAPEATGRPSYHPAVLLKLYIYGYLNRVHSSRRLEREAGRNVEVMWLTGRLIPDHKTIADFRKDSGPGIKQSVCNLLNYAA